MSAALIKNLQTWREAGWLRRLDPAFASFLQELEPSAPPALLLAAALLSHLEGRGHSCLDLAHLLQDAEDLLTWPSEGTTALQAQMAELAPSLPEWLSQIAASALVATGDQADSANTPLVLRGSRLYLRRYWAYEQRVATQVLRRCEPVDQALGEALDEAALRQRLDALFPPTEAFDWQKFACAVALRGRFAVITGGPGTGKTYTAARLLALLFAQDSRPKHLRVGLAAPTGKAAARLKQSIESALAEIPADFDCGLPRQELAQALGAARTLHSLLGARPDTRKLRADAANPLALDVLIVDEASMIHLEMMAGLLEALPPSARVIFLGDKDQLASVEAGAVLGDLCSDAQAGAYSAETAAFALASTGRALPAEYQLPPLLAPKPLAQQTVMLRESRRFGGPIGQLALAANRGDSKAATALLRAAQPLADGQPLLWLESPSAAQVLPLAERGRSGAPGGYRAYLELLRQGPAAPDRAGFDDWARAVIQAFERFRLLCAVREGEWGAQGLNAAVEGALIQQGLLSKSGEWYAGRPIMVTRNDTGLGVFNGDIGIVLKPFAETGSASGSVSGSGLALRAFFLDGLSLRSVSVSRLADVETAFAMTVHKSQGSEFEHTVLVLPDKASHVMSRELVYTGITRARKAFTLVTGRALSFDQALGRRTRRASGLLDLLDQC
ncbi:exodeoxyribonuclease V subunit alpha [Paucibacter sp. KCTC 42545]|uniref:exodeoxyribonuclease V subunit alpha n=1 Tax=Paucibacter sp. KCTC 42545 TaxID=1768242 RepID=UPI000733A574|nr:exodeoxyribonuclease V subunit alpha [Paucibacter sp. KCTC 42545]ALT78224.1 exodeoxyribonuclease V subunit alpha [Paucibacter sp. KCTC 42545]